MEFLDNPIVSGAILSVIGAILYALKKIIPETEWYKSLPFVVRKGIDIFLYKAIQETMPKAESIKTANREICGDHKLDPQQVLYLEDEVREKVLNEIYEKMPEAKKYFNDVQLNYEVRKRIPKTVRKIKRGTKGGR